MSFSSSEFQELLDKIYDAEINAQTKEVLECILGPIQDQFESLEALFSSGVVNQSVATFADLPDPTANAAAIYLVEEDTGSVFLFNKREAGLYRSNGVSWEAYTDITSQSVEVDDTNIGSGSTNLQAVLEYIATNNNNEDLGWVQFSEATPETRTLLAGVRTKIGFSTTPSTLNTNGPAIGNTWWDQVGQKFQPDSSGDYYTIRTSFSVNPTLNNRNLTLEMDIGGVFGSVWSRTIRLARGAGNDTAVTENIDIYTLGTFIANGGEIYVTCDGDIDVSDLLLVIHKEFKA